MKTNLYLMLREIAISQGHIANTYNDELVIYFFEEPSLDIDDSFRIHTKINEYEVSIFFSFNRSNIKISELGEEKITQLFTTFKEAVKYKGVFRMSNKADSDNYDLEYSFYQFLKNEEHTLSEEQIKDLSASLTFEHKIINEMDHKIVDLSGILPFLELTTIRGISTGEVILFQNYFYENHSTFKNVKEVAFFLNDCYLKASEIIVNWETIIENKFPHSFKLENNSLLLNQGYFSTIVNEQFLNFTDNILKSKEILLSFSKEVKIEIDQYSGNHPDLIFQEYITNVGINQTKDSISFQIFKIDISFLSKTYHLELGLEPMMNGFVLKSGSESLIFNLYDSNDLNVYLNKIKYYINSFLNESYKEFDDALELFQFVQKNVILDNDTSFISLVGLGLYRFKYMPCAISTYSFIENEPSFVTKSFTKENFISYLKRLIKFDAQIKENLNSVISYFNFSRKYERNQIFFAFKRESLILVTPTGNFSFKFLLKNDGLLIFKTLNRKFEFLIHQQDFLETTIKAVEAFEKQIVLTYIFSLNPVKYDILSSILSRYSLDTNGLYENETHYELDKIIESIESQLPSLSFKTPLPHMNDYESWRNLIIDEFLSKITHPQLNIEYVPYTCSFLFKNK